MDVIIYQVDAFTDKPFGGNPAGVVTNAEGLDDTCMQKIAKEMNLSETAFIIANQDGSFNTRYFTPKCEVDFCGHATIASFYTLSHKGYIKGIDNGMVKVYQHTKLGKLPVEIYYKDGEVDKILMHQDKPKFIDGIRDTTEICKSLNIKESDIGLENTKLLPEILSTGLADIIIPLRNKKILDELEIDYNLVSKISKKSNAIGFHVFTIDENNEGKVWCRNFAPLVGINEESATGTSNGALLYYLKRHNIIDNYNIEALQGFSLDRPSTIYCEIEEKKAEWTVKVGGKATIVMEGVMTI